jgi:hypothetical protein
MSFDCQFFGNGNDNRFGMIGPGNELTTGKRRFHLQFIVPMTLLFYICNSAGRPLFRNCTQIVVLSLYLTIG